MSEEELPDGSLATRYRFSHALYQNFLYGDLVAKRRVMLHRQAGDGKACAASIGHLSDASSWAHVTVAMKATFEVIFEILNCARVKALPWPVPIHI